MAKNKLNNVAESLGESRQLGSVLPYDMMAKEFTKMTSVRDGRRGPRQLFYDEHWVAARWGMEVKTLQKWRYDGIGPAWYKFGENGSVRYRLRDIVAFEKKCRVLGLDMSDMQ